MCIYNSELGSSNTKHPFLEIEVFLKKLKNHNTVIYIWQLLYFILQINNNNNVKFLYSAYMVLARDLSTRLLDGYSICGRVKKNRK